MPNKRKGSLAQHYRGPQASFLTWKTLEPQAPSSPNLHANTHGTAKSTVSHMQQAQAVPEQGGTCRRRDLLQTANREENPEVDTLTPADGIQVPQGPAAAHGPGQRPVPPGDWTGSSMWRRRAEGRGEKKVLLVSPGKKGTKHMFSLRSNYF